MKELTPLMKERLVQIKEMQANEPSISISDICKRLKMGASVYYEIMHRAGTKKKTGKGKLPVKRKKRFIDIIPETLPLVQGADEQKVMLLVGPASEIFKFFKSEL